MNILLVLIASLAELASVIIAGVLAYNGKPGWGWFILCAALTQSTVRFRGTEKKKP